MTNEEYLNGERQQLGCTRTAWEPCSGKNAALRRRVTKSKSLTIGWQCLDCGCWRVVKRSSCPDIERLGDFDGNLWDVASDQRAENFRIQHEAKKQETALAWWARYGAYLRTTKWKDKSRLVIQRDGKICRACLIQPATQAHHLSYEHVGDEPLFDLVAVCIECHERITAMDRARRESGVTPLDGLKP